MKSSHYVSDFGIIRKEARLLNSLDHCNVVKIIGVSPRTGSIALEYATFDLNPFGWDVQVTSLSELLRTLDEVNFDGFENIPLYAGRDVCRGVSYLHQKGIAHRDLKPGNVLVSNLHYASAKETGTLAEEWMARPVIAKLTDFGEGRSTAIQTLSVCNTQTMCCAQRGTVPFQSPEASKDGQPKNLVDLQAMDLWAMGMVLWCVANPECRYPYHDDIQEEIKEGTSSEAAITELLRLGKLPRDGNKYCSQRAGPWRTLAQASRYCCKMNPSDRLDAEMVALRLDEAIKLLIQSEGES